MYIMYINYYVESYSCSIVTVQTIKARSRSGTKSLEVTIPVKIVNEYDIHEGDVFSVESDVVDGKLIIRYKRQFSQEL